MTTDQVLMNCTESTKEKNLLKYEQIVNFEHFVILFFSHFST